MSDNNTLATAEYLWLDGGRPTQRLRSKMRILTTAKVNSLADLPEWSFDGSSTWQSHGSHSDCVLRPVYYCHNPVRTIAGNHYLVIAEVYNSDDTPHITNSRSELVRLLQDEGGGKDDPWIGFEQEYTFFEYARPYGWPNKGGYPEPQGPFYCGVGTNKVFGRNVVELHMDACRKAGLSLYGINAEVMPCQWEFQIGYRGLDNEKCDPLTIADQMWVARYLLERIAEDHDVIVSFDNKPMPGDWNGAGMHTNFSTVRTRDRSSGMDAIKSAIENLKETHQKHIRDYGDRLEDRLTGLHETCHIDQFKSGVLDRGASIRIPIVTSQQGYGYFEDRRPGANADPYRVAARLVESVCLR